VVRKSPDPKKVVPVRFRPRAPEEQTVTASKTPRASPGTVFHPRHITLMTGALCVLAYRLKKGATKKLLFVGTFFGPWKIGKVGRSMMDPQGWTLLALAGIAFAAVLLSAVRLLARSEAGGD
jgi:hypothetical protein